MLRRSFFCGFGSRFLPRSGYFGSRESRSFLHYRSRARLPQGRILFRNRTDGEVRRVTLAFLAVFYLPFFSCTVLLLLFLIIIFFLLNPPRLGIININGPTKVSFPRNRDGDW
jgi:hypothetical protein